MLQPGSYVEMGCISPRPPTSVAENDFASGCSPPYTLFPPHVPPIPAISNSGIVFSSALCDPLLTSPSLSPTSQGGYYLIFVFQEQSCLDDCLMSLVSQGQGANFTPKSVESFLSNFSDHSSLQSKMKDGVHLALYKVRCMYRELKWIQQPVLSHIRLSNYKAVPYISLNKLKGKHKGFLLLM